MSHPLDRIKQSARVGCPFCFEWIPQPLRTFDVFNPEGALGGRCPCGAAFIVDETGNAGGQAVLDVQALVCDGDLERGMKLETDVHVKIETRDYKPPGGVQRGHSYMTPKVWFAILIDQGDPGSSEPTLAKNNG